MNKSTRSFPEQGKFPSAEDYRAYVVNSLIALDVKAYQVARLIPGNTNDNVVREIETGSKTNPTLRTMKQIFDVLEGMKSKVSERSVAVEAGE
jgi:hypothetical protein